MKLDLDYTVYKGHQSGRIVKSQGHKDALAPDEVLLKITHAGVCGTDEHFKCVDMVLGHEGVGTVEKVGAEVDTFKPYVFSWVRKLSPCPQTETAGTMPAGGTCTMPACIVISA
jgi:threonine dehydrogenase-like Zn-dependent dehydrogenase